MPSSYRLFLMATLCGWSKISAAWTALRVSNSRCSTSILLCWGTRTKSNIYQTTTALFAICSRKRRQVSGICRRSIIASWKNFWYRLRGWCALSQPASSFLQSKWQKLCPRIYLLMESSALKRTAWLLLPRYSRNSPKHRLIGIVWSNYSTLRGLSR